VSLVSNGLYCLTLPLVSVVRVIYTSKGMSEKVWGARYILGARYLSKNTVITQYRGTQYKLSHHLWYNVLFDCFTKLGELSKVIKYVAFKYLIRSNCLV
jgi:hypothetical protein